MFDIAPLSRRVCLDYDKIKELKAGQEFPNTNALREAVTLNDVTPSDNPRFWVQVNANFIKEFRRGVRLNYKIHHPIVIIENNLSHDLFKQIYIDNNSRFNSPMTYVREHIFISIICGSNLKDICVTREWITKYIIKDCNEFLYKLSQYSLNTTSKEFKEKIYPLMNEYDIDLNVSKLLLIFYRKLTYDMSALAYVDSFAKNKCTLSQKLLNQDGKIVEAYQFTEIKKELEPLPHDDLVKCKKLARDLVVCQFEDSVEAQRIIEKYPEDSKKLLDLICEG